MGFEIIVGDCLESLRGLPPESVHCCVTSPPYWGLRDYGNDGQIGLEESPEQYVAKMVEVFGQVKRVLRNDGTLWLNLGDSWAAQGGGKAPGKYAANTGNNSECGEKARKPPQGLKAKDLIGLPWMVAFALRSDGWYLRQDIIWAKSNPMPEAVKDRCTKSHEYIFLLSRSPKYYYDSEAIKEDASTAPKARNKAAEDYQADYPKGDRFSSGERIYGADGKRNKRDVWFVTLRPFREAHFATYPPKLIEPCILAGCPQGGTVLDPFCGSGTTGVVALQHERNFIGLELNPEYAEMSRKRITASSPVDYLSDL